MKAIKLNDVVNMKLDELAEKRKVEGNVVDTKKNIVAQLIEAAHKKEVK